ncbi:Ger(x)C family spore germination protein [Paenibacillus nanensis]|uniref:Ger(X)C family spore germination protein n=1 Tax=Paenibacillus nanensis TaxID=393251 RepID=A0A3A1URL4_9BACL|nr:Ger(x)C family spore germination protein [Paenibacillus nanensis]RIX50071.1 Ger(x)C family spore germination protein [Paenibacillus nanensis]
MNRLLLIGAMILFISGCSGFKDIDKRYFVVGIGVDRTENEQKPYRVTLKLGIPSAKIQPGATNKFELVSEDAASIQEAVRLIKSKVDKELDFGHAKIILFGKTLVSQSIREPLDWFLRRRDIQLIGLVAVGDPSAREILNTSPKSERLPANSLILSLAEEGTESSYIVTESLSDFHRRLTEKGKDPYMPVIRPRNNSYVINQAAVLDKERMVGILTPDQTRVFNELIRKHVQFEFKTVTPKLRYNIAVQNYRIKYKLLHLHSSEPTIQITIKIKGEVEESTAPLFQEDWNKLEELSEEQMRERFVKVLTYLQSKKVDPVGFGLRYRAMGYISEEDWEAWQTLYPRAKFDVRVHIKIIDTGVIK